MDTPAQVRAQLVSALGLDLVGPSQTDEAHAAEVLPMAPSIWYLTGFLVPFDAPQDERAGDDDDSGPDSNGKAGGGDDEAAPEATAARRSFFPSSMGLTVLVPASARALTVEVTWGDYRPVEEDGARAADPDLDADGSSDPGARLQAFRSRPWRRTPRREAVSLSLEEPTLNEPVPRSDGLEIALSSRPVSADGVPPGTRAVSIFLVNRRPPVDGPRDAAWAFQAHLRVGSSEPLVPRPDLRRADGDDDEWDERVSSLHYRDVYEVAVGHNTSTRAILDEEGRCFVAETTWVPTAEVEKVVPGNVQGVTLGMEELAGFESAEALIAALAPLPAAYAGWIDDQRRRFGALEGFAETVAELMERASVACRRIREGIDLLARDDDACAAFQLANRAIATALRQRAVHGKPVGERDPRSAPPPKWRPFQLAFILLNLRGLADPAHSDRKVVDLLFFPTGGGKTEAYLGLAAFSLVLRRLKNPGLGGAGVGVLMRYTLRLLTLDQLGRAATLVCALELERQRDPGRLGEWPFEIGLWVGMAATPNAMGSKDDSRPTTARARVLAHQRDPKRHRSPIPLDVCPWCGDKLSPKSYRLVPTTDEPLHLEIRCTSRECVFTRDQALPIVAVDEPIYRRLPAFLIATVDKLASLPWVGPSGALLGGADRWDRSGFYGAAEPRLGRRLPRPLPPPELVIQDELHLISGPLGTMVGLFEAAIDALCVRASGAARAGPKIIASTATVRRAEKQIKALFGRATVDVFPPPGPDRRDSYFARTATTRERNARLYVGLASQGRSLKLVLLRTYLALLGAAERKYREAGGAKTRDNPADPYMTLVGYFNSLRELGGSRRIVEDEVNARLGRYGERRRVGEAIGSFADRKINELPEELTSRVSTDEVAEAKRRLALSFAEKERVDVVLATNMISVGLDITRLGLMVVLGQPKAAAEYIQATSRVGRDDARPGLVVTLLNIHRPRDRSHYERFGVWHESFYRAVEATSVTPFSKRALERGLAPVTVTLARHGIAALTPPLGASAIINQQSALDFIVETLASRAEDHDGGLSAEDRRELRSEVAAEVRKILDEWKKIAEDIAMRGEGGLQYQREAGAGRALLHVPNDPELARIPKSFARFTAGRSLRDVEDAVDLWVRSPDNLLVDFAEDDA